MDSVSGTGDAIFTWIPQQEEVSTAVRLNVIFTIVLFIFSKCFE